MFQPTEPAVSLIVPVYNVSAYLRPCLDSIEKQTFLNFEAILINDGSTDDSLSILEEYAARNPNFIVINQENRGVSEARNLGVRLAKADYITFADSDDILRKDFIERLYTEIENTGADIVCCEYKFQLSNGFRFRIYPGWRGVNNRNKAIARIMRDITVHHFCWNKIYKKSLFIDNNIYFPPMRFEDIATTSRVFYYAEKIAFIPQPLYYYVQRKGSFMSEVNYARLQDHINSFAILRSFFEQTGEYGVYRRSLKQGQLVLLFNLVMDIIDMHLRIRTSGTWRDLLNAFRQLSAFKNPLLPIRNEPWEEIVSQTVFRGREVPRWQNIREPKKTYSAFLPRKVEKQDNKAS